MKQASIRNENQLKWWGIKQLLLTPIDSWKWSGRFVTTHLIQTRRSHIPLTSTKQYLWLNYLPSPMIRACGSKIVRSLRISTRSSKRTDSWLLKGWILQVMSALTLSSMSMILSTTQGVPDKLCHKWVLGWFRVASTSLWSQITPGRRKGTRKKMQKRRRMAHKYLAVKSSI